MYKYIKRWIVISILLSGCQSGPSALDQAATLVAETVAAAPPTNKPLPTPTSRPAETLKSFPTVTPNIAWTITVEAMNVLSELDVLVGSNSGFSYDEGYLAWKQTEPVTLEMTGPQKDLGVVQAVDESLEAANFIFKSNVTWNATGILVCGLAYRAEKDLIKGKQYQFYFHRLSGLPAYSIDVFDLGRFKNTITDIRFSEGLDDQNGASNEFIVVAQDERFTVYINGQHQGDFYDSSLQRVDGLLAFLAWQESGRGNCTFEDSWVWILQ
jgi:hypothetical protein